MGTGDLTRDEEFELDAGSVFMGFRIERVIGRGGMGIVYEALQLSLERSVALKVITPDLSSDTSYRERFRREARLAAAFEHPNVLPVYEHGQGPADQLYMSLRLVRGIDLRARLDQGGALSPADALRLLGPVAAALDAAHSAGLVHRDVKPGNVLLEQTRGGERVYLTDFGLAKRIETEVGETTRVAEVTGVGQLVGTPQYMAPEQIQGGRVDGRADVYAFGCLLYRCLVGQAPFQRPSVQATLLAQVYDPPPRPTTANPRLPPVFDLVVLRALEKDPRRRAQSAGALMRKAAEELGTAARGVPAHSPRSAPVSAPAAPPREDRAARVSTGPPPPGRRSRLPALLFTLAAALALAMAGILVVLASERQDAGTPDSDVSALRLASETVRLTALTGSYVQRMAASPDTTGLAAAGPELDRSVREAKRLERRAAAVLPAGSAARRELIGAQRLESKTGDILAGVASAPATRGNVARVASARASYGRTLDRLETATRLIERRLSQAGRLDHSDRRLLAGIADDLSDSKGRIDRHFDAISRLVSSAG